MSISPLSKKLMPYAGKWVAMSPDRKKIIAAGTTIKEVDKRLDKADLSGEDLKSIIISKLPPLNSTISP